MKKMEKSIYYVACIYGVHPYIRMELMNFDHLFELIRQFKVNQESTEFVVRKYEVINECDTCVDALGEVVYQLKKEPWYYITEKSGMLNICC